MILTMILIFLNNLIPENYITRNNAEVINQSTKPVYYY